jgi:hypothetical protein
VLIPNIILGGALIKYDEMNRDLDLSYTFQRWFATHNDTEKEETRSKLAVPLMCEFIPMRWSYEAMVVAQAKLNPLTYRQERLQQQIDRLLDIKPLTDKQEERLDDLKDTLAMLSGLESWNASEIDKRLRRVDRIVAGQPLEPLELKTLKNAVTAETLYVNQKISDLVSKAETEQSDYRRSKNINVFFGPVKHFDFNIGSKLVQLECSVFMFNTVVLIVFSLIILLLLHVSLKRQLSLPV